MRPRILVVWLYLRYRISIIFVFLLCYFLLSSLISFNFRKFMIFSIFVSVNSHTWTRDPRVTWSSTLWGLTVWSCEPVFFWVCFGVFKTCFPWWLFKSVFSLYVHGSTIPQLLQVPGAQLSEVPLEGLWIGWGSWCRGFFFKFSAFFSWARGVTVSTVKIFVLISWLWVFSCFLGIV